MKSACEWRKELIRRIDEVRDVTDDLIEAFVADVQAEAATSARVEATVDTYERVARVCTPRRPGEGE